MTDTLRVDLNGNGEKENVYFDNTECTKLVIEEGDELILLGCGSELYKNFPNAMGWGNLWCVVYDKLTYEIIVKDGEILGQELVELESPSIYIGKEEAGGGIITYKNRNLYWGHQSD